jgi:hypothetical protein
MMERFIPLMIRQKNAIVFEINPNFSKPEPHTEISNSQAAISHNAFNIENSDTLVPNIESKLENSDQANSADHVQTKQ